MNTTILEVHTKAGAAKTTFSVAKEIVTAKIEEQPIHGKANLALIKALAKKLKLTVKSVAIHSGHTSKIKLIKVVSEMTKEQLFAKLA